MKRVEIFVDGFNLYYGMRAENRTCTYRKTLWLDLRTFLARYAILEGESLDAVYYFTSPPMKNAERAERHRAYCTALEASGVTVVYGRYKSKLVHCPLCDGDFQSFEEKETDVNIALSLLRRAVEDGYDKAILLSGDSDLAPAIENARALFPEKEFLVFFPLNRNSSKRLQQVSGATPIYRFLKSYRECQFPEVVLLPDGGAVARPASWT